MDTVILIGKITRCMFNCDEYGLYVLKCGRKSHTITVKGDQPKPLKTVDYKIVGIWEESAKYGKRLSVRSFEKLGAVLIATYNKPMAILENI